MAVQVGDRVAITDLLVEYCHLVDAGHPELVAEAIFTADAVDDLGLGTWRGREEIGAGMTGIMARFAGTAHVLGNVRVEVTGDEARSRAYVTAWHWLAGAAPSAPADFAVLGAYLDDLRREPQGWRVARRRFRQVGASMVVMGRLPAFMHRVTPSGAEPAP